jgi:hypothetical protein
MAPFTTRRVRLSEKSPRCKYSGLTKRAWSNWILIGSDKKRVFSHRNRFSVLNTFCSQTIPSGSKSYMARDKFRDFDRLQTQRQHLFSSISPADDARCKQTITTSRTQNCRTTYVFIWCNTYSASARTHNDDHSCGIIFLHFSRRYGYSQLWASWNVWLNVAAGGYTGGCQVKVPSLPTDRHQQLN